MEVEVYQKIKEGNKERIQRYKGIVIKVAGKSELEKTITVRRKIGEFALSAFTRLPQAAMKSNWVILAMRQNYRWLTWVLTC